MNGSNPLSKYFRQVKSYVAVPSSKFVENNHALEFSNDRHEVSIKPMTAVDEVILKNPDALLNGEALAQVLKSCVAEVKDPYKLYINDVNVMMAAIKSASYGKNHPVTATCPSCKHENDFNINLEGLLQQMTMLEQEYLVHIGDLKVYVQPFTLRSQVNAMSLGFEESKTFKMMEESTVEDAAKIKAISKAIKKMASLNFDMIADSVVRVVMVDGTEVKEKNHIAEFVVNIDKDSAKKIEEEIIKINKIGLPESQTATCTKCSHEWEMPVSFDPTTFFTAT